MNAKSERGAVIIESTLSLTLFMFAVLTVLSMYHICLAQARISAALNETAREISQYSYIYDLTNLNAKQAEVANRGGAAQSILSDNLSEVDSLFDALMGSTNTVLSVGENGESFLYYTLNQGIDGVKGVLCGEMARGLMKKHFGSDPDKFLKGLGIENGIKGLSFIKTRLFVDGHSDEILLDVRYQVTVIKLLDIDLKFNFELCAKTKAWTS